MEREAAKLVLDASVAVKWVIQEDYRDYALKLREEHVRGSVEISAPSIIVYEVVNALRYNPELSEADVKKAAESLFGLHMKLEQPTNRLIGKAAETAYKYSVSIYDAAYLGLSELKDCPMITADQELYGKTSSSNLVMLLSSDRFSQWLNNLREASKDRFRNEKP